MSLNHKLRFTTLLSLMLISLLYAVCYNWQFKLFLDSELMNYGKTYLKQLIPATEYPLIHKDLRTLQGIINASISNDLINAVSVYNREGKLIAFRGDDEALKQEIKPNNRNGLISHRQISPFTTRFISPISMRKANLYETSKSDALSALYRPTEVIGYLSVDISNQKNLINQYAMIIGSIFILMIGLLFGLILTQSLSHNIYRPIKRLKKSMQQILNNKLETPIESDGRGEFAIIEQGCQHLQQAYLKEKEELSQNLETLTKDLELNLESLEEQNIKLCLSLKDTEKKHLQQAEFIANMSHEIRTPMTSIIGFSSVLQESKLTPSQLEYVNTIKMSAHNLVNIVNDILDFTKIEVGQLKLDIIPIDIRSCIDEVLTLLAPNAHKKGLSLNSIVEHTVPIQILGDPLRIKQVITNLVSNAIKFTEKGFVTITLHQQESVERRKPITLNFSVEDSGIGISQEEHHKLFTAFSQADISTTRRYGGTGLGLVISQKLVHKMGGDIALKSTPGEGSVFSFQVKTERPNIVTEGLPFDNLVNQQVLYFDEDQLSLKAIDEILKLWQMSLQKTRYEKTFKNALLKNEKIRVIILAAGSQKAAKLLEFIEENNPRNVPILLLGKPNFSVSSNDNNAIILNKPINYKKLYEQLDKLLTTEYFTPALTKQPPPLAKTNILLADDDPVNRKLLNHFLSKDSMNLTMAEDGQSALFNSQKNHYDVIILDLNMPLLDGLELSHKIRSSTNPNQFCPILIISANLDLLSAEKIKQAGINECLQKPFSETSLQHKIKLLLNPATTEPVNWHKLTKQVSGKIAVAEEILQQFLVELDENALLLEMALLKNDFKNALEMTHKLLGGSQFCALDKLSHILHELESLFKIEKSCTPQLFMLFGQLKLIHHTLKLRIPLTSLAS